jgi:GNAT superfamily N-acetyltransferase
MPDHAIWQLTESDAEAAGSVLGRAFQDYGLFRIVQSNAADRTEMTHALFVANVRHACRYGEAWASGPAPGEIRGVIYWVDRPEPELSEAEAAEIGFVALGERWGPILEELSTMEHAAIGPLVEISPPWRYLAVVGVDPEHQGQGYGTVLVTKVVADARAAGLPVGLATDGARNVPLYERCGFRVIREMLAPDGETKVWTMRTD